MQDGYILKSKSTNKLTPEELKMINSMTRRSFAENEIYSFSVVLCDNDIDRDFDRFTDSSLEKLAELYIGKTGILDHNPSSENQTARIFSCKVETLPDKLNKVGQPYKRLLAKAYMPNSEKNKNIILEIDSGIKKEVSVGCSVENRICSVCGKNLNHEKCSHKKGRKYKVNGTYQVCHTLLDNPLDAYEWSFVAVPAQPKAGVIKAFSSKPCKGGDKNMEEIMKSLSCGESINLSAEECSKITEFIKNLQRKASEHDTYLEELTKDVLKLGKILEPELSETLIKSALSNLSISELHAFKKAFKSKLAKNIPVTPQFAPEKTQPKSLKNIQFKI